MNRLVSIAIVALGLGTLLGFVPARLAQDPARPLSARSASERLAEAFSETDPLKRLEELAAVLARTPADARDAVLDAYRRAPLMAGEIEFVPMMTWWARVDPEEVLRLARIDPRYRYRRVVEALFREWAKQDPARAVAALDSLKGPLLRDRSAIAAFVGADESGRSSSELVDMLRSTPGAIDASNAVAALVRRRLLAGGEASALAWARQLAESGADRAHQIGLGTASALAVSAPESAAAIMSEFLDPKAVLPEGPPLTVGMAWVGGDGPAAMSWLASLPEGEAREKAVRLTFLEWLRSDPQAAREWLDSKRGDREAEVALEPALDVYARVLSKDAPREALDLARRLSSGRTRDRATAAILSYWVARDRAAAEAWMQENPLDPEVKADVDKFVARREANRKRRLGAEPAKKEPVELRVQVPLPGAPQ